MTGAMMKTTSRFALAAAAGMFVGGMALSGPASAADLGGDCCADLEERVAELEATTVRKGNRKVSLKLSGQVSRVAMYWDDGDLSDVYFLDNDQSSTRVRLTGGAKIREGWSVSFVIEWDFQRDSNGSGTIDQGIGTDNSLARLDIRKSDIKFKTPVGSVTLGRGDMASNGITEIDLSLTGISGYSLVSNAACGFHFRTAGTTGTAAAGFTGNTTICGAFSNLDGYSRRSRVRWDSPTFAGFTLSTSHSQGTTGHGADYTDVALRFRKEMNGIRVAAGIAWGHESDGESSSQWSGSASVVHLPSGLNITVAGGDRDFQDNVLGLAIPTGYRYDDSYWYIKLGWYRRIWSKGVTAFYIDYYDGEDQGLGTGSGIGATSDGESWGIGVVQRIDAAALELFLGYRQFDYDTNFRNYDEFSYVHAGARIKF